MAVNNLTTKKNGVKVKVEQAKKPQKLGKRCFFTLPVRFAIALIFILFLFYELYLASDHHKQSVFHKEILLYINNILLCWRTDLKVAGLDPALFCKVFV